MKSSYLINHHQIIVSCRPIVVLQGFGMGLNFITLFILLPGFIL